MTWIQQIGVLGGGQLGRMLAIDSSRLGYYLTCLDPNGKNAAAKPYCNLIEGSYQNYDNIMNMPGDVITVEIEHVNLDALYALQKNGRDIQPPPETLRIISDKLIQKNTMKANGIPLGMYIPIDGTYSSIIAGVEKTGGFPVMLKARCMAKDGCGNAVLRSSSDIESALLSLGSSKETGGFFLEKFLNYQAELSCIVARDKKGHICTYELVETRQTENVCQLVVMPLSFEISESAKQKAIHLAISAVRAVKGAGIFAVEMFWMGGEIFLYNEMAPRPHNSGHLTIEACVTSQFEQHIRCISGLNMGDTSMRVGAAAMVNILGLDCEEKTMSYVRFVLSISSAKLHWYGKSWRKGRKLGHITVTADNMNELRSKLFKLGEPLDQCDISCIDVSRRPLIGIIMGSDSDLSTMKDAAKVIDRFEVPYEITIVSAHRTPDRLFQYATEARKRGIEVIIAGAGGAAHLPGMVAALTTLPVIGIPIKTSTLNGNDSLLSIVQMPQGVPVATMAIGNAMNGGLFSLRILASSTNPSHKSLTTRLQVDLENYHNEMRDDVCDKAHHLEDFKYETYLHEYFHQDKTFRYLPRINSALSDVIDNTNIFIQSESNTHQPKKSVGKVRDCYNVDEKIVLISTDRLSAFDRSIASIPFKGAVLNLITVWWFERTEHIIKNHLLKISNKKNLVHPNVIFGKQCEVFPIEFVVRGYMTGSSGTSLWTHYKKGVRNYCGHTFPDGFVKNQKLLKNICTPTTKEENHDNLIDSKSIIKKGLMTQEDWEYCERKALELFEFGQEICSKNGLILVDTKYEFGKDPQTGEIYLVDEIHTPDSSRFWIQKSYDSCFTAGKAPEHIDKEFLRLWFVNKCDPYKVSVLPTPPRSFIIELSRRYIQLYEMITGESFPFPSRNSKNNIEQAINQALWL